MDSNELISTKLTEWENEPKLSELKEDFMSSKPSDYLEISRLDEWKDLLNVTGNE